MKNCPICDGKLSIQESYQIVMDGNTIYLCENDLTHKFWVHPFSYKIIHHNPKATVTNWTSLKSWKYENGTYTEMSESHV